MKVRPPLSKVKSSGSKGEAFDRFPLGEVRGEAGDFVFDEFADPGVGDHFLIRSKA